MNSGILGVEKIIRTIGGCPERFEGILSDGRAFDIKCRWGYLTLWIDDLVVKGMTYPDEYTGMVEEGDIKKLFYINNIEFNDIEIIDAAELADL